ncbi:MAG: tRNA(Met) cytidine acetyltransferase TmcA domain-containing protein, partial [Desulfurococcaceae archaeon]
MINSNEIVIPSSFKRFLRDLGKVSEILIKGRIRALIVISGSDPTKLGVLAARTIEYYVSKWFKQTREKELKGLYVFHDEFPDAVKMKEIFENKVSKITKKIDFEFAVYEKSERYLGITIQILVMDLTKDL